MLYKQGYMHAHAHARARAHTQICNIYCFSTTTMIRERASMLRYTYIACLVMNCVNDKTYTSSKSTINSNSSLLCMQSLYSKTSTVRKTREMCAENLFQRLSSIPLLSVTSEGVRTHNSYPFKSPLPIHCSLTYSVLVDWNPWSPLSVQPRNMNMISPAM
jgi:hypothetical protein